MNSHNSGSAAPVEGTTVTSGVGSSSNAALSAPAVNLGPVMSKGLASSIKPPASNSVTQTHLMNAQNIVASAQPVNQATGRTVTLVRPPVQTARSGATLNGSSSVSPAVGASTTCQTGVAMQSPLVNSSQSTSSVSVSAGSHIIKAEPPATLMQSAAQPAVVPSTPRAPATVAAGAGGVRSLTPQVLVPRLPQTSPGQPGVHNIQLPPGELFKLFLCAFSVCKSSYFHFQMNNQVGF